MVKSRISFDEMRTLCRNELKKHEIRTSTVDDYQRALSPLISFMKKKELPLILLMLANPSSVSSNATQIIAVQTGISSTNQLGFSTSAGTEEKRNTLETAHKKVKLTSPADNPS